MWFLKNYIKLKNVIITKTECKNIINTVKNERIDTECAVYELLLLKLWLKKNKLDKAWNKFFIKYMPFIYKLKDKE